MSGEVTELLQNLIRNACVNDGTAESGQEVRSTDLLEGYLEGSGLDVECFEPTPGRKSLVARIEGRRADVRSLLLMGHTDVVPVSPDRWREDPFGGELVDGWVWGRGAVDMLNLTSSMAVAVRRLAESGFQPDGTLIYLAVADEEALGSHGAGWLAKNAADAVGADYVITEAGGFPVPSGEGLKLPVMVGEKGAYWCRLTVRGVAGHASQPYRTDNAVVTAAEVVHRLSADPPETRIHEVWRAFLDGLGLPEELSAPLLDPDRFDEAVEALPIGMSRMFHVCTHDTIAPTMVSGGTKLNVIPDAVTLEVDIRTLPGQTGDGVRAMLDDALGDLAEAVEVDVLSDDPSSSSPMDTPLWDVLAKITPRWYEGSSLVPFLTVGATDARFFRRMGTTAYGFGLFSQQIGFDDFTAMFHGDNERVDVESLRLSTELWEVVAKELLAARIRVALFDFGGVLSTSPFDVFARFERERGLPEGLIRRLNATNPDDNAWARLERGQVDLEGFASLFADEAAAAGYEVHGPDVLELLHGEMRPEMVEAVRRCGEHLKLGLLTNNFVPLDERPAEDPRGDYAEAVALFDVIVESSVAGVRKPDPRFYELACEKLEIEPAEAVFLDDLGVNLKPARAMGMTTIKVDDPARAIKELESVVGFPLA